MAYPLFAAVGWRGEVGMAMWRACTKTRVSCAMLAHLIVVPAVVAGQRGADGSEWRHYGGDPGSTKYSRLAEITP